MKCRHARKAISPYIDRAVGPDEKKDFEAHIRDCAACRKRLEELQALHSLFAGTQEFPAPYGFASRIMANLEEREESRFRFLVPVRHFFLRIAQTAVVLAVLTIGILSGNVLMPERPQPFGRTAVQQTFSLDLFQAMPPDSVAGIYDALMRSGHEK